MTAPRAITEDDLAYWAEHHPRIAVFTTPDERLAGVAPCEGIITTTLGDNFGQCVRVPVVLDADEVARLAAGGTLWLSTWGGLPMWMIEVQEP